jgi:excisionase family DNA binding protein
MAKGKNVLTTGDVAKICNVAPRTVSKWFDSGQLKGYRIPGSKDRRIPLNELVRFMKAHNMPTEAIPMGKLRVLIVDNGERTKAELVDRLAARGSYEVEAAYTGFETGAAIQRFNPHVVLINLMATGIDANGICRSIRGSEEFETVKIIALANSLSDHEAGALMQKGFDGYVSDPSNEAEVVHKIEEATAIIY